MSLWDFVSTAFEWLGEWLSQWWPFAAIMALLLIVVALLAGYRDAPLDEQPSSRGADLAQAWNNHGTRTLPPFYDVRVEAELIVAEYLAEYEREE